MKALHDNNYWEVNAELLIIKEFDDYYSKDKSKGKEDSSKVMWGLYYCYHPESKFYNLPNRLEIIENNFIKDPKFKWDSVKSIVDVFKNLVLSDAERALGNWGEIMSMRDTSIKELYRKALEDSDTDELVKIDKMLANTPKMFEDYKKIKKDYQEEKTLKKGKRNLSLSDTGDI
jgi:hypothetical protein